MTQSRISGQKVNDRTTAEEPTGGDSTPPVGVEFDAKTLLSQIPPTPAVGFACEFPGCGASFGTKRGVSQHARHAHKDWLNTKRCEANPTEQTKRGSLWTKPERRILAEAVIQSEALKRPKEFNTLDGWLKQLANSSRSLDAIKKQRQDKLFKEELAEARTRLSTLNISSEPANSDAASASPHDALPESGQAIQGDNAEDGPEGRSERTDAATASSSEDWEYEIRQTFYTENGLRISPAAPIITALMSDGADIETAIGSSFEAWAAQLTRTVAPKRPNSKKRPRPNANERSKSGAEGQMNCISKNPTGRQSGRKAAKAAKPTRAEKRATLRWQAKSAFRADPYKAGKAILNGEYGSKGNQEANGTAVSPPSQPELEAFWGGVFETPSPSYRGQIRGTQPTREGLLCPVSLLEVEVALREASLRSSPGPDKLTFGDLRKCERQDLVDWMNVSLLTRRPPSQTLLGRVTLVPKVASPTTPSDFRPITVASTFLRLFHSVLARRWDRLLPFPTEQRGFRAGIDGCMDNTVILRNLLKYSKRNLKPLCALFVDIKNAFGAASQDAVMKAVRRLGVPEPMVEYLRNVYDGFAVTFKNGSERSYRVKSGVLQGDPLSAVAFNALMALVMSNVSTELGVPVPNSDGQHLAYVSYADDTVMLSETREGLSIIFAELKKSLGNCSLALNAKKCASFELSILGKQKCFVLRSESFLTVNEDPIPPLGREKEFYRYLGTRFSPAGVDGYVSVKTLKTDLDRITTARIDPPDRLFVLKNVLVPRISYSLTVGEATGKTLKSLDVLIRREVRRWLHLPHDVPLGMFHSKTKDGGLGIPCLALEVLRWRAERLGRTLERKFPILEGIRQTDLGMAASLAKACDKEKLKTKHGFHRTKEETRDLWRTLMVSSCDGRGLSIARDCPQSSEWLTRPNIGISGKEFVKAIHVRLNALKTPARAGRGGRSNVYCPTCRDAVGGLGHILQRCPRSHGYRVARHNSVTKLVKSFVGKAVPGIDVVEEPIISPDGTAIQRATRGSLKPDLVFHHRGSVTVIDPTIVADCCNKQDLLFEANRKIERYDNEQVRNWAMERFAISEESLDFKVIGLPITWRGFALAGPLNVILERLHAASYLRVLLPIRTLVFGWSIWSAWAQKRTDQNIDQRRPRKLG